MDFLTKLEKTVLGWFKAIPNLPVAGQKWLGDNVWWIALIGAILTGLGVLVSVLGLFALMAMLGSVAATYYTTTTVTSWAIVTGVIGLAFSVLEGILLAVAVQPLKEKQKKGWVLLFAAWLVVIISIIINAILTLNFFSFIVSVLFGAVWVAISGYFLIQIHGQFAHTERSRGVKEGVVVKK